jgi:foldase protein PrsA
VNKSKRIKKVEAEVGTHDKTQDKLISSKVLKIVSIVFVVILIGALIFDQLYDTTYVTVDGKKYHMDDLSYYIYNSEYQYDYYDQMFGGNGAYWNMTADENGSTFRDLAKQEAIDNAIYNEILYNEAISQGYSLTEEEQTTVETNAATMLSNLSKGTIENGSFTKKSLADVLGKIALATRFRQEQIDALDIDDEGIKAGVSREEYRQYDIEYLFASTKTTDDEGNSVDMTEDEKKAALNALNSYSEKAKTAEDWSELLPEDEENVTYRTTGFIKSDTTFEEDLEAQIMAMENGAISEVKETEDGYYIIRMVNNDSSERYDSTVKDAISTAESEGFKKLYEDEILPKHEYVINYNALKSLNMGSTVLSKY